MNFSSNVEYRENFMDFIGFSIICQSLYVCDNPRIVKLMITG